MTWREHAACSGADPRTFFPDIRGRGDIQRHATPVAELYCAACPVRSECLAEAHRVRADHAGVHGVWSGIWFRTYGDDIDLLPTTVREAS